MLASLRRGSIFRCRTRIYPIEIVSCSLNLFAAPAIRLHHCESYPSGPILDGRLDLTTDEYNGNVKFMNESVSNLQSLLGKIHQGDPCF